MHQIEGFNDALEGEHRLIAQRLRSLFDRELPKSLSKLYHGAPVWFLDENPIVGYSVKKSGIAILFWSGQSFKESGLTAVGKYKAAELIVRDGEAIPGDMLERWLSESQTIIWDYKNIAKKNGVLELLKSRI